MVGGKCGNIIEHERTSGYTASRSRQNADVPQDNVLRNSSTVLASCLIYARAYVEYVYGCVLFQDVTGRDIRGS